MDSGMDHPLRNPGVLVEFNGVAANAANAGMIELRGE